MPLIIITGLPCSGKTHRAQQVATSLTTLISSSTDSSISKRTVQIISSYHASSDPDASDPIPNDETSLRDQIYTSASLEKTARAAEFSAVKRAISKDNIVIADGLNYIKGYRYQLWCEAKAVGTRCCVVHVAAREEECTRWNRERLRAWGREVQDEGGKDTGEEGGNRKGGGKEGENVMGDLMPESHTAIYGDRVVESTSRSRSSSLDGSAGERDEIPRSRPTDETITLKSLYISPRPEDTSTSTTQLARTPSTSIPQSSLPPPSIPIPPPTSAPSYSPSTLSSLCMRYEPPSPFSRWDTPLFTLPSTDTIPPLQEIWNAIYPAPAKATSKKALSQLPSQVRGVNGAENVNGTAEEEVAKHKEEEVKRHAATVLPKASSSDALQTLESATMDVVKHILAQARAQSLDLSSGEGGDVSLSIPLPNDEEAVGLTIRIPSGVALSQPMLQRLRRKYTQIQRGGIAHGQGYVAGRRRIIEGFVGFLEGEWDEE